MSVSDQGRVGEREALAYRLAGGGPRPVVFVHGMCQGSIFWQPDLEALPAGFVGHAIDLPGFGDSRGVSGPYSIETHAAAVADHLTRHDLREVVLVGNSMGGVVCQMVAIMYSERLARLTLVATGPNVPDPAAGHGAAERHETGTWGRADAAAYVQNFFVRPPADVEPYIDVALQATRDARASTMHSSADTDLRPRLGQIHVPTLIVQGERDGARTPVVGAEMARLIPDARLEVIPGVGHTPMLEDPTTWRPIFHRWLAEA